MKEVKYSFGEKPFNEWLLLHPDVEVLVLSETMTQYDIPAFEKILFDSGIKALKLQDFSVANYMNEDGSCLPYVEAIVKLAWDSCSALTPFNKIIANANRFHSFIFEGESIYSEDRKALFHVPESVTDYVHPKGVEYIGKCAFSASYVGSLTFNDSLIEIGEKAFSNCNSLSSVVLPNSVTTLGEGAFASRCIDTVQLSENLHSIPNQCFMNCNLDRIQIPSSVKYVGVAAFDNSLEEKLILPEGVQEIDHSSFVFLEYLYVPASLKKIASDFYYDHNLDSNEYPPYIDVHPDNPIYYAKKGSLYFKQNGKLALDAPYNNVYPYGNASCDNEPLTREEIQERINLLLPLANKKCGGSHAQCQIGKLLYYMESGTQSEYEQGLMCIKKSAEQNYL